MATTADRRIVRLLAHAIAYDFSIGKTLSPRAMFLAQTKGCRERFLEDAASWLGSIRAAGLEVRVKTRRKRA